MKENKSGFTILFYLMMQRTQKTHFLNVGHTGKSHIAIIVQASWHNISTFKQNISCNKLCKVLLIDHCTVIIIVGRK